MDNEHIGEIKLTDSEKLEKEHSQEMEQSQKEMNMNAFSERLCSFSEKKDRNKKRY